MHQLPFFSFIGMSCMTPPHCQRCSLFAALPLSPHLHYQTNYCQPNWKTHMHSMSFNICTNFKILPCEWWMDCACRRMLDLTCYITHQWYDVPVSASSGSPPQCSTFSSFNQMCCLSSQFHQCDTSSKDCNIALNRSLRSFFSSISLFFQKTYLVYIPWHVYHNHATQCNPPRSDVQDQSVYHADLKDFWNQRLMGRS